jgi:hypothetical protein
MNCQVSLIWLPATGRKEGEGINKIKRKHRLSLKVETAYYITMNVRPFRECLKAKHLRVQGSKKM